MINGRYLVKDKIGEGRSKVFLCSDSEFPGNDLAIKILPGNSQETERKIFRNEFFTLRKLNHPNIIKANEFGIISNYSGNKDISIGSLFITLEYFRGEELSNFTLIQNNIVILDIIKQLCSALYYLHQSNYIYYDLKLENILVSEISNKPVIKLIDLGFAQNISQVSESIIRGTSEYIAPEILRKENHDFRVDLYSLGILLYKLVYGEFPFDTKDELGIYKAHLEKEFEYPPSDYNNNLISIIKKLLSKNPDERFHNTIEVISALNLPIDQNLIRDWIPARIFSDRADILNIINTFFNDILSNEIITIRGSQGSGKTSLVEEINYRFENVILIKNNKAKTGFEFVKFFLNQLVFSKFIFEILSPDISKKVNDIFVSTPKDLMADLKVIFTSISTLSNFTIILDDFNSYDDFTFEIFKNIIPILQINKTKVILTENSDLNYISEYFFNLHKIYLNPFTGTNVEEFVILSFNKRFPQNDLIKLIMIYADLLPGNIVSFIRDIIYLQLIEYKPSGISIKTTEKEVSILRGSQGEIFNLRLDGLSIEELEITKLISSFNITLDVSTISKLTYLSSESVSLCISDLQQKNIFHQYNRNDGITFTSDSLKKYVYSKIENPTNYHKEIADNLIRLFKDFNKIEIARHYELSENHIKSYELLWSEVNSSEKLSAFAYQKNILLHLLRLRLNESYFTDVKYRLVNIYYKLGEFQNALSIINELLTRVQEKDFRNDILFLKGVCLIGVGENENGKNCLTDLLPSIKNETRKQSILVEIASAEFEMNKFESVNQICISVIANSFTIEEDKAKCYNILGLIGLFKNDVLNKSVEYFEKAKKIYEELNIPSRIAQMNANIGIIYNIQGNHESAKHFWTVALKANKEIGNLEQEGKLLINFGIYYYDKLNFSEAIENYKKAVSIFSNIGDKFGEAQSLENLSEVYLYICNYQEALNSIENSILIFSNLKYKLEELFAQFILAKLIYIIGDFKRVSNIVRENYSLLETESISDKIRVQFLYLFELEKSISGFAATKEESLLSLQSHFYEQKDIIHFFSTTILIVEYQISLNRIDDALATLTANNINNLIKENVMMFAEQKYMLGIISKIKHFENLLSPIEYFISAFDAIKEFTITELTWKILYQLGCAYYQRGNYGKAKENLHYSKEIIIYFADLIKDKNLRDIYLKRSDRENALKRIIELGI